MIPTTRAKGLLQEEATKVGTNLLCILNNISFDIFLVFVFLLLFVAASYSWHGLGWKVDAANK